MDRNIDFISENDFKEHVRQTILKYGETLTPYDVQAAKNIDNEGLRLLNAAIGRNSEGSLLSYGADVDNPPHNMSAG